MSWYTVDREVEAAGYLGVTICQRRGCLNPPTRTQLIVASDPQGQTFRVGAFQFCEDHADDSRGGTMVAFGSDMEGQYAR